PLEPRLQQRITEDCSDVGAIISTSLLDAPWLTQLETIAAPALIVHGSKPDQSPGDGGPWLAGKLPNAKLVTIQDAGHDPWLDEPNAFFRAANAFVVNLPMSATASQPPRSRESKMFRVPSKDGTLIAVECAGSGPTLIIVHGGVGDRTRWTPMFPLLSSNFTVCAMDRRGHGLSADSADYSLQKEAKTSPPSFPLGL